MKRILKFLARLYPAAWRTRYGAEYEALLEDTTPRPQDAFNILWAAIKMQMTSRSFVRIVLPCTVAALIAVAISFTVPPLYISQTAFAAGEFYGTTGDVVVTHSGFHAAEADAASAAEASDVVEQERILSSMREIIFDRSFLASTIQEYGLYPHERAFMPLGKVVDKMQRNIEVKRGPITHPGVPGSRSGFILEYAYSDRVLAERIQNVLINQYLKKQLRRPKPAGISQPHEYFAIGFLQTFPRKPHRSNRLEETAVGLLAGLLSGLILATILNSRQNTTALSS